MPRDNKQDPLARVADLLKEGQKRFDKIEERLEGVEKAKNRTVSFPGTPAKSEREFSLVNLIRGAATGDWRGAEFEREASEQAKRDMSYGTPSAGGYVVPEQYLGNAFIDTLNAKSVVLASGATQLNGLTSTPVVIPKKTGNVTTYYKAENADITESQPTLDEITLTPNHLTAMTVMSNEVLAWSNPSIEAMVRNDIATQLALRVDLECLEGDGLSNNPAGVLTFSSAGSVSVGSVTVESLYDMLYELELANADLGTIGWVMHPRSWNQIRQLRSDGGGGAGTGPFLVNPDPTQAAKPTLLGFPVRLSTQVSITEGTSGTDSYVILANWADGLHATWGALEIMASQEASDFFHKNQTGVRAVLHHDWNTRHEESFVIGDGVSA